MSCLFADAFPDRFFNMGIAEANTMGVAAGLAIAGHPVVASGFSIFGACRAYEQVRNPSRTPAISTSRSP